jgi:hypothetical protein
VYKKLIPKGEFNFMFAKPKKSPVKKQNAAGLLMLRTESFENWVKKNIDNLAQKYIVTGGKPLI